MTIEHGVLGSYPTTFVSLNEAQIKDFIGHFTLIQNEEACVKLLDRFAIRRS